MKLVTKNVFPSNDNSGSPSGKYIILIHLNGCVRQVVIDDLLPQSHDKSLHVVSQTTPDLIYPALIEKGFLKVMGGYDFPGSNSAMDLTVLTGWIPEVVHLHRYMPQIILMQQRHGFRGSLE
jgi:calpain-7